MTRTHSRGLKRRERARGGARSQPLRPGIPRLLHLLIMLVTACRSRCEGCQRLNRILACLPVPSASVRSVKLNVGRCSSLSARLMNINASASMGATLNGAIIKGLIAALVSSRRSGLLSKAIYNAVRTRETGGQSFAYFHIAGGPLCNRTKVESHYRTQACLIPVV